MTPNKLATDSLQMQCKEALDSSLQNYFQDQTARADAISTEYAHLWKSIELVAIAGGKRIRPYQLILSYLAYAADQDYEKVIPAALAQELLHIALLIHDDIIDNDTIRRGIENVAGQYVRRYEHMPINTSQKRHLANGAALLAGDLLIAAAQDKLLECKIESEKLLAARHTFSEVIFRVCSGELLDMESVFASESREDAQVIAEQKTASYSFMGPLVIGAQLAGAAEDQIEAIKDFAHATGTAFQLQDDLLGVFGEESVTGKSNTGDITEGKYTYIIESFYRLSDAQAIEIFKKSFGNAGATQDELRQVKQLLIDSGAVRATEELITKYVEQAHASIEALSVSNEYKKYFVELIDMSTKRSK